MILMTGQTTSNPCVNKTKKPMRGDRLISQINLVSRRLSLSQLAVSNDLNQL